MLREKKGLKSPKKLIEKALLFKRIMFDDLSTVLGLEFWGLEGGRWGSGGWLVSLEGCEEKVRLERIVFMKS